MAADSHRAAGDTADQTTQEKDDCSVGYDSTPGTPDDHIHWRYLTWDTLLPPPVFPPPDRLPEALPSASTYENIVSPLEWKDGRKQIIIWLSCIATVVTASTPGAYTAADAQMEALWHVSAIQITVGITIFTVGFAVAPMVLAPFSEINGRQPVFVATGVLFALFQLWSTLTRSYAGMLVSRFLVGCVSSTFSTMVGGVVSDIYSAKDRNTPMALFAGAAMFGTGLGPLVSGFVAARVSWRWVFGVQTLECAVLIIAIGFLFKETRASVLLSRKAAALNTYYEELEKIGITGVAEVDESGAECRRRVRWKVRSDEERASIGKMIAVSLHRPFHLLVTEPVVSSFSLWISFAWMVLYLTFGAIPLVFETLYALNLQQACSVFASICVAAIISTLVAIYGDKLLVAKRPQTLSTPEGRLISPCFQSLLLPIGLFWFGWTSYKQLPWILPAIGIAIATMGIYSIYLCVFNYLSDCYGQYASSALAAQSFCRNLAGGIIPLVVVQMYDRLGFHAASSLLGGIGILLSAVPVALIFAGPKIRARSKVASGLS